jgi:Asp-tRNA(Asn)/Glu-tRNA(Gln) amidotransferase A subunit family amidase
MAFAELRADEYAALSARALGRLAADGHVSPVQLVELALRLAKATEPSINAYVSFLEPLARSVAHEREREARAGHLRSALHGVPIAVNDNFYLKGFPLARGSRTAFKLFESVAAAEVPPGGDAEAPLPWITWTPYTYPFNLSGQPAISLPCGLAPDGMPVAVQIVGPFGSDALVLAFAREVESALAFREHHPLRLAAS